VGVYQKRKERLLTVIVEAQEYYTLIALFLGKRTHTVDTV
jgi:hypothetical protein